MSNASQTPAPISVSLSVTLLSAEIARARYIQNGGSAEVLRKALEVAHIDLQKMKADNQELTKKNAVLEFQLRLATHQKKTRAKGSTRSPEELAAVRLGSIFMIFFTMRWDVDMFGPPLVNYQLEAKRYETPDANNNYVRFQLYRLVPMKYHEDLLDPLSLFAVMFEKSGRVIRTQSFFQTRGSLLAILGDNFPCRLKSSHFLKSNTDSEERASCEDLRFLLGHNGSSSGTACPYSTFPPILFEDFDVGNPEAFMRGETFYQLGRFIAYGKSSMSSPLAIREQSNGMLSSPDFSLHATSGFIACIGVHLVYVLSPDKEFPNMGIGALSHIRYYDLYLAFKQVIHSIEHTKLGGGLKAVYNEKVFPTYVPGASSGTSEEPQSVSDNVLSHFHMFPAVYKMMRAIKAATNPSASQDSPSPLSAQPTVIVQEWEDNDSFYAQDPSATLVPTTHCTNQSGLEGQLTSLSLSTDDMTDGAEALGAKALDREATVVPETSRPARRTTCASAKTT
ncbi:hypothetical protein FA15DRAFT_708056 [Coprinopsis marcescibilis]|uniref:Uncharacterized protein n=1 Tax=Coprinopsis marcescibilis TaxID=230819 RepID=A0A5C3KKM8_COPMA|nr:hypothetical protein FA15DRAFT_708056 [Coprinopsis marcescibilis]